MQTVHSVIYIDEKSLKSICLIYNDISVFVIKSPALVSQVCAGVCLLIGVGSSNLFP